MNTPTVYLCGPISFLKYEGANDWREYATGYLEQFGIKARSPLRGKDFLKEMGIIGIGEYTEHPLATDNGIIARDRFDVRTSDLMLANLLGAEQSSIGSPAEFAWADAFGTPVVTAMEKEGSPYDHPFIRGLSGYRVETLDEALTICRIILL